MINIHLRSIKSKILAIFLVSNSFFGVVNAQKVLRTDDFIYEEGIKTALLYPGTGSNNAKQVDMLNPPIISLTKPSTLVLEFDELGDDMQNYYVKIFNCNADWSISQLNPIQFLNEYNEYQITERAASFNTRIPYIHYKFFLPRVKTSGNFLVMVYRDMDDKDFIITKRFMVFEDNIVIAPEVKFSMAPSERNTSQQVDFHINYSGYEIINPLQNLKVMVRQNFRWNNSISSLKPSFVSEDMKKLDYIFFNNENAFKGVNEFRFFDIRSNRFSGVNVANVRFDPNKTEVTLGEDRSKSGQAYSLVPDHMNGKFAIENYESGDREIQPDYVFVTFVLDSKPVDGKIFVLGELSNWNLDPNFEMKYNTAINKYMCRVLLKQGYYNYRYVLANGNTVDETYFEGSHSATQNIYDILAYFRPFGSLSDKLIGYKVINYLGR